MGREQINDSLRREWACEFDNRLIKALWTYTGPAIAVRFAYEWHDGPDPCYRCHGSENLAVDDAGFMMRRFADINDLRVFAEDRQSHWLFGNNGRRPDDLPGLTELGLKKIAPTGSQPAAAASVSVSASACRRCRR